MKKSMIFICLMLSMLLVTTGCEVQQPAQSVVDVSLPEARVEELHALSVQFTQYLNSNDIESAMAMMNESVREAVEGNLGAIWAQYSAVFGSFVRSGDYVAVMAGDEEGLEMTLFFENGSLIQKTVFDADNHISGLWYRNGSIEAEHTQEILPEGIEELSVIVDAGEGYPLAGKLTLPSKGAPVAAVVLVQGSGSSDMNEALGPNAPFRDLAHALAQKGIAVLRYDKRTYTYGMANYDPLEFTIDEEVAFDVIAAVNLLKSLDGIDPDKIYVLGHSLSGGLLSYINSMGANCAGYIVFAGSPRNVWELSLEQNLLVAEEIEQGGNSAQAEQIRQLVKAERKKATALADMSAEEAISAQYTIFGMAPRYLHKIGEINAAELHLKDGLPVLILQGEKDRQVTMTDFALWQEMLKGHPNATFISYPELNHIFGDYEGDAVPFSQMVSVEYMQRTPVADEVINDIANWIFKLNR